MGKWICKKCGCEIIAECIDGTIDGGYGIIKKDKSVELIDFGIDFKVNSMYCENCGNSSDELEDIAEWEEE